MAKQKKEKTIVTKIIRVDIEKDLSEFKKNNPHCSISIDGNGLRIDKPWGCDDCLLVFDLKDTQFVEDLNKIKLSPKFDAIIHMDNNAIEFIFAYLLPKNKITKDYMNREFTLHFDGTEMLCKFAEPTSRLMTVARAFKRLPSEEGIRTVPQLLAFKDSQKTDKLSDPNKAYFTERVPRSFFLQSSTNIEKLDLELVARHVNFLMQFYDRKSPTILIRSDETKLGEKFMPLRYIEDKFPSSLVIRPMDDVILKLLEVANISSPRFAFLYYYQIFEYAGYYYLDNKIRSQLMNLFRTPTIVNCSDEHLENIIGIMSEFSYNDEVRMRKAIEEKCDPCAIWKEIEHNKDFFCEPLLFDGGFQLNALISNDMTENSWRAAWMPKLFDCFTKIRNCIVHAREKRESRVILPTKGNNRKIERYLPLIARTAEQLAICS